MLVLHAAWLPARAAHTGRLAVWGETAQRLRAAGRRRRPAEPGDKPRPHPFAATVDEFQDALLDLGGDGVAAPEVGRVYARLPTAGGLPLPSPELGAPPEADEPPALAAWTLPALLYPPATAAPLLLALGELAALAEVALGD